MPDPTLRDELATVLDKFSHEIETIADALVPLVEARVEARGAAFAWAEMLTGQSCTDPEHPDWYVDSEHNHRCPWCAIQGAEAEAAELREQLTAAQGRVAWQQAILDRVRALRDSEDLAHDGAWPSALDGALAGPCGDQRDSHVCVLPAGHTNFFHEDATTGWPRDPEAGPPTPARPLGTPPAEAPDPGWQPSGSDWSPSWLTSPPSRVNAPTRVEHTAPTPFEVIRDVVGQVPATTILGRLDGQGYAITRPNDAKGGDRG